MPLVYCKIGALHNSHLSKRPYSETGKRWNFINKSWQVLILVPHFEYPARLNCFNWSESPKKVFWVTRLVIFLSFSAFSLSLSLTHTHPYTHRRAQFLSLSLCHIHVRKVNGLKTWCECLKNFLELVYVTAGWLGCLGWGWVKLRQQGEVKDRMVLISKLASLSSQRCTFWRKSATLY